MFFERLICAVLASFGANCMIIPDSVMRWLIRWLIWIDNCENCAFGQFFEKCDCSFNCNTLYGVRYYIEFIPQILGSIQSSIHAIWLTVGIECFIWYNTRIIQHRILRQSSIPSTSSDKKLEWSTNFWKCAKSWFVAEKCFYSCEDEMLNMQKEEDRLR